jgi:hypothetical protein
MFGTRVGRFLSKYMLGPAVGSYVLWGSTSSGRSPSVFHREEPQIAALPEFIAAGVFLFLLLHVPPFRTVVWTGLKGLFHGLRIVLWDVPRAILRTSVMRRFFAGPIWRWVLKPAIPAALAFAVLGDDIQWPIAVGIFVLVEIVWTRAMAACRGICRRLVRSIRALLCPPSIAGARHVAAGYLR